MPRLVVHHLNDSRSHRVLWLLEELGLDYDLVLHARDARTRLAPDALKAVHPLGKAPILVDDGLAIIESAAIIEHLCLRHGGGKLWPVAGSEEETRHRQWLHYAEGSAMLPLMLALYTSFIGEAAAPLKPRIESEIGLHLGYIDATLAQSAYAAGPEFRACDVQLGFVLEAAGPRLTPYGHAKAYLERLQARPAYLRAIEKGGPYALGPR